MSTDQSRDGALVASWGLTLSRYLALMVIGLAWTALLARSVGPVGTGEVLLASTLPALLAPFVNLGLPSAVGWLTAREQYDPDTTAGAASVLAVVLGAVSCSLVVGVLAAVGAATNLDVGRLILGATGLLPFVSLSVVAAVFLGRRRFGVYAILLTAAPALALCVGVMAELLADPSPSGFVGAWIGAYYVVALGAVFYLGRRATVPERAVLLDFTRRVVSFGWKVWIGESAVSARTRADLYLVAGIVGAGAAGLYGAAVGLATQVSVVSQAAYFVVFPTVAQAGIAESDRRRQTAVVARLTFVLSLAAALVVALAGRVVIDVFLGSEFTDAYLPLVYYLPTVVILSVSRVLTAAIMARGLPGTVMWISLVTLALNLALNLALIPVFELRGAAAAASLTAFANASLRYVVYRRIVPTSLAELLVPRKADLEILVSRLRRSE